MFGSGWLNHLLVVSFFPPTRSQQAEITNFKNYESPEPAQIPSRDSVPQARTRRRHGRRNALSERYSEALKRDFGEQMPTEKGLRKGA